MKRILITMGASLLVAVPATLGLVGNTSFAQSVPVRVPAQATVVDDNGGEHAARGTETGDDNGGQRVTPTTEATHHNERDSSVAKDDNGGHGGHGGHGTDSRKADETSGSGHT